ncbi:MAG: class I SAM-dependent methyltransferase [Sphingomonadales bacterium]
MTTGTLPLVSTWIGRWHIAVSREVGALGAPVDAGKPLRWHPAVQRQGVPLGYQAVMSVLAPHLSAGEAGRPLQALDCGVGAGHFTAALAQGYDAPLACTATDVSPGLLEAAAQRFAALDIPVATVQADSRRLPFPSCQFDVVIQAHMLEHHSDWHRSLAELLRVLRPGGTLIVAVTRRSLLSLPLRLMWHMRAFTPLSLCQLLSFSGFTRVMPLPPVGPRAFRQLTLFAAARKPLQPNLNVKPSTGV